MNASSPMMFVPGDLVYAPPRAPLWGVPTVECWMWSEDPSTAPHRSGYVSIGLFRVGIVMASSDTNYVLVIDSITCKLGWINHSHVERVA